MTGAEMMDAWRSHLADGRRRSPHTVRAYSSAAARLIAAMAPQGWQDVARIDGPALRAATAQRGLAGVLAKRRDAPYRPGADPAWVRVTNRRPR